MTNMNEIKDLITTDKYSFLTEDEHLGNNIILLTLGGSHAYGTNNEQSDLDLRGCALNSKMEILTNKNFEQFTNVETDTVIYSFNKLITLLSNVNPNTIEMLGCKKEHYLHISKIGQELLDNSKLFLSKRAIHSFGGYANQQLRRLENKSQRENSQSEKEVHILNTINCAMNDIKLAYKDFTSEDIALYIDKSDREDFETEIFMDVNLKHYPLRDYKSIWSEMNSIVKSYSKIGIRNSKAIEHGKIGKHMMHLVRLYLMCFDILEKEEIITYRENEIEFLLNVRNGMFLNGNTPTDDFYDLLNDYEKRLNYAKENTSLPNQPNYKKIEEFVASVNERIVRGNI